MLMIMVPWQYLAVAAILARKILTVAASKILRKIEKYSFTVIEEDDGDNNDDVDAGDDDVGDDDHEDFVRSPL